MEQITNSVLEAIQKNLPSATAGELKKFIEEAEQTKRQHENLSAAYEKVKRQVAEFEKRENELAQADKKLAEAKGKEADLEKRERDLKVTVLTEQFSSALRVAAKYEEFLALLVKNPRAVELISETRNVPVWETYSGGGGYHTTKAEITSGIKERQETKD